MGPRDPPPHFLRKQEYLWSSRSNKSGPEAHYMVVASAEVKSSERRLFHFDPFFTPSPPAWNPSLSKTRRKNKRITLDATLVPSLHPWMWSSNVCRKLKKHFCHKNEELSVFSLSKSAADVQTPTCLAILFFALFSLTSCLKHFSLNPHFQGLPRLMLGSPANRRWMTKSAPPPRCKPSSILLRFQQICLRLWTLF